MELHISCRGIFDIFGRVRITKSIVDVQLAFIGTAVSSVSILLLRVLLSNDLGSSGLGIYTIVFTIYLFGQQFSNFGIGYALTKYISEGDERGSDAGKLVSSGILGSLAFSIPLAILLYFASGILATGVYHYPEMGPLLVLVALSFPFLALQRSVLGVLNGQRLMNHYALLNILQNGLIMIASVILVIVLKMGLVGAILGILIPTILVGLLSVLFVKGLLTVKIDRLWHMLARLYKFSGYITANNLIFLLNTQINVLLAGYFLSSSEVGYFSVASTVMQGIFLIPYSIQLVNGPIVSKLYARGDTKSILNVLKKSMISGLAITIVLASVLAVFGNYLIGLVFNEEFLPAYGLVMILIPGYIIYSLLASVGSTLAYMGKVDTVMRINVICAIISILSNLILIGYLKLPGAALATSISLVITTLLNLYMIIKVLNN